MSEDNASSAPPAVKDRAVRLLVSGTLKKTTDGYAVTIFIAEPAAGQRGQIIEYAYGYVRQLYSDCSEVARRLAQACGNRPPEVLEYKTVFGAGVFFVREVFFPPENSEWAEYTTFGLTGFVLPQVDWGLGIGAGPLVDKRLLRGQQLLPAGCRPPRDPRIDSHHGCELRGLFHAGPANPVPGIQSRRLRHAADTVLGLEASQVDSEVGP